MELHTAEYRVEVRAGQAVTRMPDAGMISVVKVEVEVKSMNGGEPPARMQGTTREQTVVVVPGAGAYKETVAYLSLLQDDIPITAVAHLDGKHLTRGWDSTQGGRGGVTDYVSNFSTLFRAISCNTLHTQRPFRKPASQVMLIWTPLSLVGEHSDSWHLLQESFEDFGSMGRKEPKVEICYVGTGDHAPWACHTNLTPENDPAYAEALEYTLTNLDNEDDYNYAEPWATAVATVLRSHPHPHLVLVAQLCLDKGWTLRPVPSVQGLLQSRYGAQLPLLPQPPPAELDLWLPWTNTSDVPVFAMAPMEPGTVRLASNPSEGAITKRVRYRATAPGTATLWFWYWDSDPKGDAPTLRVIVDMQARDTEGTLVPMTELAQDTLGGLECVFHSLPTVAAMLRHEAAFQATPESAEVQQQALGTFQELTGHLRQVLRAGKTVLLTTLQSWLANIFQRMVYQQLLVPTVALALKLPRLYPGAEMRQCSVGTSFGK